MGGQTYNVSQPQSQVTREKSPDWKSHSCGDVHSLMRNQGGAILQGGSKSPILTGMYGGPLQAIESLDLSVTELYGWGLQFLATLPHLKDLNLCGTNISDDGLRHLLGLQRLETLKVNGNKG